MVEQRIGIYIQLKIKILFVKKFYYRETLIAIENHLGRLFKGREKSGNFVKAIE